MQKIPNFFRKEYLYSMQSDYGLFQQRQKQWWQTRQMWRNRERESRNTRKRNREGRGTERGDSSSTDSRECAMHEGIEKGNNSSRYLGAERGKDSSGSSRHTAERRIGRENGSCWHFANEKEIQQVEKEEEEIVAIVVDTGIEE